MAVRKIIQIDEERCNGCGLCAAACHEGAIGIVDGKARLLRDDYCDGFGDCLPACPMDAISFVEREAADYDEAAVVANKMAQAKQVAAAAAGSAGFQCPGTAVHQFNRAEVGEAPASGKVSGSGVGNLAAVGDDSTGTAQSGTVFADDALADPNPGEPSASLADGGASFAPTAATVPSQIASWPIQIKLVPPAAPYFDGCRLLVAADCTAFAYGNFHHDFMAGRVTIIACPKLDAVDYAEKLTQVFAINDIADVTVARMEVPCCGGLEMAVRRAIAASGKDLPLEVVTFSLDGRIL